MSKTKRLKEPLGVVILAEILGVAIAAARAADPGQENDGGTANFDSLALRLPRLRDETVKAAADTYGVSCHRAQSWGPGWWLFSVGRGQGARNTAMVKAAQKAVENSGLLPASYVSIWYQID